MVSVNAEETDDTHAKDILVNLNIIDGNSATVSRLYCITATDKAIGATDETVKAQKNTWYDIAPFSDTVNPYVLMAWEIRIAFGDRQGGQFLPDKTATYKETCAFLIRCLIGPEADTDVTFEKAKELGLVKESDEFYNSGDEPIDFDSFCIILNRFINQPRALYFTGDFSPKYAVDSDRSMTYLEMLQQRFADADSQATASPSPTPTQ